MGKWYQVCIIVFPCNSSMELQNFGIIGRNNKQSLFLHTKRCHALSHSLGVHSNCVSITQGWYRGGEREDHNIAPGDRKMSLHCSCLSIYSSQGNLLHSPSLLSCSASQCSSHVTNQTLISRGVRKSSRWYFPTQVNWMWMNGCVSCLQAEF